MWSWTFSSGEVARVQETMKSSSKDQDARRIGIQHGS